MSENSLSGRSDKLLHIARFTDLNDPELVKKFIANKEADVNYRHELAKAYNYYVNVNGLSWKRPKYNRRKGLLRPPSIEQVKQLIAAASKK